MQKKILFINQAHPVMSQTLTAAGYTCVEDTESTKEEIESKLSEYDGIVLRSRISIDKQFLKAGKHLDFIAREGVGLEHIDVEYAESIGITVFISPEGSQDTVGEHAIGMLLNLLNKINTADRQVRAGQWLREENRAVEVKGKTIGIIGYGNMGTSFARKISGFEVKCLTYDKYKTNYGDEYAEESTLERIFQEADIVTLHIPFEEANYHFVDEKFINSFVKNIYIINTARGLALKTSAVTEGLKSGKVLGVGLDVLEYEKSSFSEVNFADLPEPFHYLISSDKVVLAPHIAGWSFESKKKHGQVLAKKIMEFYEG